MGQDQWLSYFRVNLMEVNDLVWAQILDREIQEMINEFNAGRFRGAIFHLNFQATEKRRFMDKVEAIRKQTNYKGLISRMLGD